MNCDPDCFMLLSIAPAICPEQSIIRWTTGCGIFLNRMMGELGRIEPSSPWNDGPWLGEVPQPGVDSLLAGGPLGCRHCGDGSAIWAGEKQEQRWRNA